MNSAEYEYVQGQIDALHALILAVAESLPREDFRGAALLHLQAASDKLVSLPVPDVRLKAIGAAKSWVMAVT